MLAPCVMVRGCEAYTSDVSEAQYFVIQITDRTGLEIDNSFDLRIEDEVEAYSVVGVLLKLAGNAEYINLTSSLSVDEMGVYSEYWA